MAQLDRIFGQQETGYCYSRFDNPSNAALEELVASLENGASALACASGMAAIHTALVTALTDRRKSILAAKAMYGQSVTMLMNVFEPLGIDVRFVDTNDLDAVRSAIGESR